MKEVDFLPEWYKSGRRREVRYRTQYIALGIVFAIMMLWNIITARSIKNGAAELALAKSRAGNIGRASRECAEIQSRLTELQKKAKVIKEIDSKIDVASVLAELSFLVDEKIVLSKVELIAENFIGKYRKGQTRISSVAVEDKDLNGRQVYRDIGAGDVRFKVVIRGIASDARKVAELICRLEDSPYFQSVYPSFSKNTEINTKHNRQAKKSFRAEVSEFEIVCYLGNFCEK
jgi:hypothetical protein